MIKCINVISLRVINSGSEQKQIFLRLLLQLINDKLTHGDVLMAILDAMVVDGHVRPRRGGERGDKRRELKREGDCFILVQARAAHRMGLKITQTDV